MTPSTSSMTMAAPDGPSTYSYSRTTYGLSRPASVRASARKAATCSGSRSRSGCRYLIATGLPEASCVARTTSPNPPPPSTRTSVYPGTAHTRPEPGAAGPGVLAADVDMSNGAPLPGAEDLQSDLLRGLSVPGSLVGDGHEHRGLPGGD